MRSGLIGGVVGYWLLKRLGRPDGPAYCNASSYREQSKLSALFGVRAEKEITGRSVLDFGCGEGHDCIDAVRLGARQVIGLDIRESVLNKARRNAMEAGVADRCIFVTDVHEKVDVIVCIDSMEHFSDPVGALTRMAELLQPEGRVLLAFGPPWLHPYGGHLFSVLPWAHLLFTEEALIRWRSDFKSDNARSFGEVEGGLNQMTVGRFLALVDDSPLVLSSFKTIRIRRLGILARLMPLELSTSIVVATLQLTA